MEINVNNIYITEDEFIKYLDKLIPPHINNLFCEEAKKVDLVSQIGLLQEKARVLTIKEKLSKTHKWEKATVVESFSKSRKEIFWCQRCHIKCSNFEYMKYLPLIAKVNDNLPTYTVHNTYLMFSCDEAVKLQIGENKFCIDCGIHNDGLTLNCNILCND